MSAFPAPGLRIALSATFAGRPVGSGAYVDALTAALRASAPPGESLRLVQPSGSGALAKLYHEQIGFPRAAHEHACDVAHVPYWAPPLRSTVPTVVTVHDLIPLLLPEYRRDPRVRAYTALVARATRSAAMVLADSAHTAADCVRHLGLPADRVRVAPLGVEPRFAAAAADPRSAARRTRLALPQRYGLYLGGFDPRKDVATLLAAWRTVFAASGVPLVVAGRLPEREGGLALDPRRQAADLGLPPGSLRFLGAIDEDDKPALYAGAALFAFPSRYEGFGLPPLEAMAAGAPVVAADATSLPEVVGEAGRLVAPAAVAQWTEALLALLGDEAEAAARAAAGRRRAAGFTWAAAAAAVRTAYDDVAGG